MIFTVPAESSPEVVGYILIAIAFILGIVVPTIISLFTRRSFDRFFAKKEQAEKEQKEMADKVKAFECQRDREERKKDVKDAIEEAVAPIKQDLTVIKRGTQAGLRHDLVIMADEWLPKGYCPRSIKVEFENMYNQYHSLGKNGVMDNTYQAILDLPESIVKTVVKKTKSQPKKTDNN